MPGCPHTVRCPVSTEIGGTWPYLCKNKRGSAHLGAPSRFVPGYCDCSLNMWHDQEEWVTCRQYSILIFKYKPLVHLKCYILIQTLSQSEIWLQRYGHFFEFKNNVKQKNLSPLLACNSKSIFSTSDSFPLIMSHIVYSNVETVWLSPCKTIFVCYVGFNNFCLSHQHMLYPATHL